MARVVMDQGAVERLIGGLVGAVSHASISDKLGPGEEPPDSPAGVVVQYLGCDFEYAERVSDNDAHVAAVQFEVALLCPMAATLTRAWVIQTAASAVQDALGDKSTSDANGHRVQILSLLSTRVDTDTPGYRAILITGVAEATRSAGATFET